MDNKICLITGATNGIGKATAKKLLEEGFHVVFTARSMAKAESTVYEFKHSVPNCKVDYFLVDLASLEEVREFANKFITNYDRLDVLINNAGVWEKSYQKSKDGYELTFAVNHLAHFLLTNLLLDLIMKTEKSRIINVSSRLHIKGTIDIDNLNKQKAYNGNKAYANSKLANILFTRYLAKKLDDTDTTVNALMPGIVNTGLFDNFPIWIQKLMRIFLISPEKGAQTSVYLATSEDAYRFTGEYFDKKKPASTSKISKDMELAKQLWDTSLEMTKLN